MCSPKAELSLTSASAVAAANWSPFQAPDCLDDFLAFSDTSCSGPWVEMSKRIAIFHNGQWHVCMEDQLDVIVETLSGPEIPEYLEFDIDLQ